MKNKLREASDQHYEQLHKLNQEHESQVRTKDQIIQRVTETLEDKESIIQVGRNGTFQISKGLRWCSGQTTCLSPLRL